MTEGLEVRVVGRVAAGRFAVPGRMANRLAVHVIDWVTVGLAVRMTGRVTGGLAVHLVGRVAGYVIGEGLKLIRAAVLDDALLVRSQAAGLNAGRSAAFDRRCAWYVEVLIDVLVGFLVEIQVGVLAGVLVDVQVGIQVEVLVEILVEVLVDVLVGEFAVRLAGVSMHDHRRVPI